MRAYVIQRQPEGPPRLAMIECEIPTPKPGEVLVRIQACALNYRDQRALRGLYFEGTAEDTIHPLSDGAGEVVGVGAGVEMFKAGDRVASTFFPDWAEGPMRTDPGPALGGLGARGMLADYVALPARHWVPIARNLDIIQAATLPCAGVTAWNALFEGPRPLQPGGTVLVLGTGGVSLFALQLAKAAGATVIATSGSDEKLTRAKALGADHLINYARTADWGREAARLVPGGADHVVEIGGAGTLGQSIEAASLGGEIAVIGTLAGPNALNLRPLIFKAARLRGLYVGSRAMALRLNRAVEAHGLTPVIDRVFRFEEAAAAYAYQGSPQLFGKVVIRLV